MGGEKERAGGAGDEAADAKGEQRVNYFQRSAQSEAPEHRDADNEAMNAPEEGCSPKATESQTKPPRIRPPREGVGRTTSAATTNAARREVG